jgi:hypothetical protein
MIKALIKEGVGRGGCGEGCGSHGGLTRRRGLRGRVGRLATGPNGPEVTETSFPNKNLIFDYSKALEICRRFRRNFEVGIFPKFF